MKTAYRVLNGMKARGVPKNFSAEERQKRAERIRSLQPKAVAAILDKAENLKRKREEQKRLVRDAAALGQFIPVQDFE